MVEWDGGTAREPVPVPRTQARRSRDRREELLRAATRILLGGGLSAMTLDAVAREAATSKGGLLHHFPSKAKLQESLLDDLIAHVSEDLVRLAGADSDPRGRCMRAYVHALVASVEACDRPTVLAKLMFEPAELLRWRTFSEEWLKPDLVEDGPDHVHAVRILVDGSCLALALGLGPTGEVERAATLRRLLSLTLP